MTRHSKNNTDGAVFTYHEKRAAGFGSKKQRVGSDSVSPDGYLFDKQYIYENLIRQKKALKSRLQEWEAQRVQLEKEQAVEAEQKNENEKAEFAALELGVSANLAPVVSSGGTTRVTSHGVDVTGKLKTNFWLPTNTPLAKKSVLDKPDMKTKNPISDLPLRVKDLVPVKFTSALGDKEKTTDHEKKFGRYMCPVCSKTLTNAVRSAVLRATGAVLCATCIERFVKKEKSDPMTGKPVNYDKDVIFLKSGGTGYAGHRDADEPKEVTKYMPSMRS